jgi:hypothetical protein
MLPGFSAHNRGFLIQPGNGVLVRGTIAYLKRMGAFGFLGKPPPDAGLSLYRHFPFTARNTASGTGTASTWPRDTTGE